MVGGLSVGDFVVVLAAICGVVCLIGGLILLFKEQRVIDPKSRDRVEIEIPLFGKLRLNFPAAIALLIGGILVGYPMWSALQSGPKLRVSGKIHLKPGEIVSGIMIGILPSSHLIQVGTDGNYFRNIPRGEDGMMYHAIIYSYNTRPPIFHMGVVKFDADGRGTFDYIHSGSSAK